MKKLLIFILLFISPGIILLAQPPTPVAWYPLNGDANDAVGTVHGTVTGAKLTKDRFGNPNSAYYFDGIDDVINLGKSDVLRPTDSITIMAWVRMYQFPSINGNEQGAIFSCIQGPGYQFTVRSTNIELRFQFPNDDRRVLRKSLSTNAYYWHHIAATYNGTEIIFYFDGQIIATNPVYRKRIEYNPNVNTLIGADPDDKFTNGILPKTFWNGKIDEIKVYNIALTGQQVLDEYNQPDGQLINVYFLDADNDGFGNLGEEVDALVCPDGYVATPGDCNDLNATVYPGAPELYDGLDNDCDPKTKDPCPTEYSWYRDADNDGFGNIKSLLCLSTHPKGYVANFDDCRDWDPLSYPGAPELCDGKDNNCNGQVDEGLPGAKWWYLDLDKDGYGNPRYKKWSCTQPKYYVPNPFDCNDNDPAFNPRAPELPDGKDNDCDGQIDEGLICVKICYPDADRDGFGNNNSAIVFYTCVPPVGYADNNLDCRDWDATIFPGAPELCDGKDNDCDGEVDEGWKGTRIWYKDKDGDGYGNSNYTKQSCIKPSGYVDNSSDCKDWDANVYPGHGCPPIPGGLIVTNTQPKYMVETSSEILVFPNPARDEINVILHGFEAGKQLGIQVIQVDGKVVSAQSLTPFVKSQQVRVDVRKLSAGYYLLQVKQGYLQQVKKVMIVR